MRKVLGSTLNYLSKDGLQGFVKISSSILPRQMRVSLPSDKLRKISKILHSNNHTEMYNSLIQVSEASLIQKNNLYHDIENYSKYWNFEN